MSGFIPSGGGGGGAPTGVASGDLGGTYPSPTVVRLTGTAGVITIPTATSLAIGTSPSSNGLIRTPYDASQVRCIIGSVHSNAIDYPLIKSGQDSVHFGDTTGSTIVDGSSVFIYNSGNLQMTNDGNTFEWSKPFTFAIASTPSIKQLDVTTNSATGATTTIQAQNATGLTATGGNLILSSGTGTTSPGIIILKTGTFAAITLDGATLSATIGPTSTSYYSFSYADHTISIGAGAKLNINEANSLASTWKMPASGAQTFLAASTVTSITYGQTDKTTNSGTGATLTIQAQNETGTTSIGGNLVLSAGTGTSIAGALRLKCANVTMIEAAEVVAGNKVIALGRKADLTSTQMPANTGDGVIYLSNAATVPTANPVSGVILYATAGGLVSRGTSGTITQISPA